MFVVADTFGEEMVAVTLALAANVVWVVAGFGVGWLAGEGFAEDVTDAVTVDVGTTGVVEVVVEVTEAEGTLVEVEAVGFGCFARLSFCLSFCLRSLF